MVVLNKADLSDRLEAAQAEAKGIAAGARVYVVSAETGTGIDSLAAYVAPGRTLVLLGPSGVGKSSIINRLLGESILPVNEVREGDARGKHTTTWSELRVLPGGGVLIDTPGMREVLLWSDEESVDATFAEILALAGGCKFGDCRHGDEPGCAVRAALESGELDAARFDSYLKLRDEVKRTREQLDQGAAKRGGTRAVRVRREKRRRWKKR